MERSEPSFIPGWLKGAAGGGLAPHHYQDEGGFSRNKVTQQLLAVGNHLDSPRGSVSSDRVFSPSSRRYNNSSLERPVSERDHFSTVRLHSGLNRSSSTRSHDMSKGERDVRSDREYEHEGDRDFHSRKKEWLLGIVSDEREKNREYGENGMFRFSPAGLSGKYDTDTKLRRSQSMGLSPRLSDSGLRKLTEVVSTVPSASGGLATSMQKAIFEHNFPSLGADEKQSSLLLSSGNASIASPRPLWQGSPRPDLSRASSPGLPGGFANSISTVSASVSACDGGIDVWSSALAEAPTSNGNVQGNSFAVNVAPVSSSSQTSASVISGPAATVTPLNMAEALTQIPPRVRTPPQLSLESQRLEELALRQSRQLIPMTPSLPKTMSLVDKSKSKTPRTVDGTTSKLNQLSGSLQLNLSHKSVMPARPDTPKHSQGKLLVLKSSKDGGVTVSTTSKSDGTNVPQVTPQGNIGLTAASATNVAGMSVPATGVLGQRRQAHDRRAPSLPAGAVIPDGSRAKDPTLLVDDRRTSLQAQNRSDFFNALRKKAAGNGSNSKTSGSSNQLKSGLLSPREAAIVIEDAPVGHDSESKDNGVGEHSHCTLSSLESGGLKDSSENGLIMDSPVKDFSVVESQQESLHSFLLGDSEEEEAAFMRSLGWEENAEGSELTEEEINAFYQMRERKKLLNSRSNHNLKPLGVGHFVGSVGSMSSGLSSSDSETDEEPSSLLRRALSNTVH